MISLATALSAAAHPPRKDPFRHAHPYIDPVSNPAWGPARTDMGVDWLPAHPLPLLAIGDAVILGSDWQAPWLGSHIIWYQLLDGSHAGDMIYVAEHLRDLLPVGRMVHAGEKIALALPGYPWTEWGWADKWGTPRAYPCYYEGKQTNSGREMARSFMSLGARVYDAPGRGSSQPSGALC